MKRPRRRSSGTGEAGPRRAARRASGNGSAPPTAAPASERRGPAPPDHDFRVIVIGASAGGVEALSRIVASLPPTLPAAVFVAGIPYFAAVPIAAVLFGAVVYLLAPRRPDLGPQGLPVNKSAVARWT